MHDVWSLTNVGEEIYDKLNNKPNLDGLNDIGLTEEVMERVSAHIGKSPNMLEAMRTWKVSDNDVTARAEYIAFIVAVEEVLELIVPGPADPDQPGVF